MNKILLVALLAFAIGILEANPTPYKKGYGPGEQEYGYVDVRKRLHMFYWLFYVQDPKVTDYSTKPLVIWLQGGPGGSSTGIGNFGEIGPLFVNGSARPTSWAKYVNLMFIDNPVGAGFSYADDSLLIPENNTQVGKDMISFLKQFYTTYPKFQKSPMYIYSQSYGGKMAVEIAKQLQAAIKGNQIKCNFKGVGLGDPWISPVDSVTTWAPYLYQMGIISQESRDKLQLFAGKIEKAVKNGQFRKATDLWSDYEEYIWTQTSYVEFYNIMYKVHKVYSGKNKDDNPVTPRYDTEELRLLMNGPVKKALNVPARIEFAYQSSEVFNALEEDFMKPVVNVVEELLNQTDLQVVIYNGNLDLMVDTPGTVEWVDRMKWKGAADWKKAKREPVLMKGFIEGYVKNVGNLYFYWVHRAGLAVPTDNPETALEILRRSTKFDK